MTRETVLVTGASSGIGRALTHCFAADGANLVLVARREDVLQEVARVLEDACGVTARVAAHDLAEPNAPRALFDRLAADDVSIDVLVNNAGFGARGTVAELDLDRQLDMIQVNVSALTHLTRLFLPGMLKRNRGGILNVASTAAFQPGPSMSVYYATKAYVLSFTEGLAEEVAGTALRVSCLAPGPTDTPFADRADTRKTLLFRLGTMDAQTVARAGYAGFRSGEALVVPGLLNKLGTAGARFAPRAWVRKIAHQLQS